MTDKPRASHRSTDEPSGERVVIRDKRKIDSGTAKGRHAKHSDDSPRPASEDREPSALAAENTTEAPAKPAEPDAPAPTKQAPPTKHEARGEPVPADTSLGGGLGAELAALRTELEERTRDLQRVTAEYANYRKRVDRDRGVAAEQTTGNVLSSLLPILDDLDRAREHGDLVGPFASVAEQLGAALSKFGLTGFGEKGDPFDPTRHEAVAHLTSTEVNEPTCVDVLRRGYLLGERLLRPAMVAVADPE